MIEKDLLLLSTLRANARESLTKISRSTAIPVSTIFDRLRLHEKSIIKKHTAIIDFTKLGFSTRVTITMKANKADRDELKRYLLGHHNVNSVFKINNGYDFQIEAIFRSLHNLEEFLEKLEERFRLRSKQVYYIIDDIKREAFLADPSYLDILGS